MATIVEMPKLSDTMSVGILVSWLVDVGAQVAPGDIIAEIETDKATMELENFDEGTLLAVYAPEGTQVDVGAPICAIGEAGEDIPEVHSATAAPAVATGPGQKSDSGAPAPPLPAKPAESEHDAQAPAPTASRAPETAPADRRMKVSPVARKLAAEHGLALDSVTGTGPGGRIVKADVLGALEAHGPPAPTSTPPGPAPVSSGERVAEEQSIPVSNIRALVASRLLESKTQVPHFYLDIEIDAAPLLDLRSELNDHLADLPEERGGGKLSVNDFILKATAEAIRRVPEINVSWMGQSIRQHGAVDLAFAVSIDDGLVAPVIRDAHAKTLRRISAEARDLVQRAKQKNLHPDHMTGSTITVTNLGMFGIRSFYAIINPPNAAILSVGAIEAKPVVGPDHTIVPGQRMMLGLSGDHRAVDGATGARFLAALKEILETPALMLV